MHQTMTIVMAVVSQLAQDSAKDNNTDSGVVPELLLTHDPSRSRFRVYFIPCFAFSVIPEDIVYNGAPCMHVTTLLY